MPNTITNKNDLFTLFEEVWKEQESKLTEQQRSMLSDDFFQNTLFEIFSGIDYTSMYDRGVISENNNKTWQQLIQEQEEPTEEQIRLGLPKLRISEAWGQPGSNDRMIIQRFTAAIPGDDLKQKLQFIDGVATGKVQMASLGQILGSMVVLEVLYTILSQFTESAGGFIFEGFLAGLFGKDSVQITDVDDEDDATGKPITDVVLGDREYSLKLLNPTTQVKGSWRNMVEHFKSRDHVVYLDARRSGSGASDSLQFGEFIITLPNFMEVFYEPFKKFIPAAVKISSIEDLNTNLEELGDSVISVKFDHKVMAGSTKKNFIIRSGTTGKIREQEKELLLRAIQNYAEAFPDQKLSATLSYAKEDYAKNKKAQKLFGSARQFNTVQRAIESGDKNKAIAALIKTDGYINQEQFIFTRDQAESIGNFQHIQDIFLGEDQLKKTWVLYGGILKKTVTPVYTSIARFNEQVSNYFMGATEGGDRKSLALAAQQELGNLKEATDEAISAVEQSEKDEYTPEKAAAEE